MTAWKGVAVCWTLCAIGLLTGAASQKNDKPIVIVMTANGTFIHEPAFKMKKKGAEKEPVEVKAGQSVIWRNDDAQKHSAVSDLVDAKTKKPLFDTEAVPADDDSKPIAFTADIFERAFKLAGKEGESFVVIPYTCREHPPMKGKIKLSK